MDADTSMSSAIPTSSMSSAMARFVILSRCVSGPVWLAPHRDPNRPTCTLVKQRLR